MTQETIQNADGNQNSEKNQEETHVIHHDCECEQLTCSHGDNGCRNNVTQNGVTVKTVFGTFLMCPDCAKNMPQQYKISIGDSDPKAGINESGNILNLECTIRNQITEHGYNTAFALIRLHRDRGIEFSPEVKKQFALETAIFQAKMVSLLMSDALKGSRFEKLGMAAEYLRDGGRL